MISFRRRRHVVVQKNPKNAVVVEQEVVKSGNWCPASQIVGDLRHPKFPPVHFPFSIQDYIDVVGVSAVYFIGTVEAVGS